MSLASKPGCWASYRVERTWCVSAKEIKRRFSTWLVPELSSGAKFRCLSLFTTGSRWSPTKVLESPPQCHSDCPQSLQPRQSVAQTTQALCSPGHHYIPWGWLQSFISYCNCSGRPLFMSEYPCSVLIKYCKVFQGMDIAVSKKWNCCSSLVKLSSWVKILVLIKTVLPVCSCHCWGSHTPDRQSLAGIWSIDGA